MVVEKTNDEEQRPVRCWVHQLLIDEFKLRKEILEKETGYKLSGGLPLVSKIAALELKKNREKNRKIFNIELSKIRGVKKNKVIRMWE
jgi:hypothetical protein